MSKKHLTAVISVLVLGVFLGVGATLTAKTLKGGPGENNSSRTMTTILDSGEPSR